MDVQPPYDGDKPVINAYLCADEGLVVHLSYSLNPVGTFYFDSIINLVISDAEVMFYENNEELFTLQYLGEGIYMLPDTIDFLPTPGNIYRISIESPKYGKAQSSNIIFPNPLQATLVTFEKIGTTPFEGLLEMILDWQPQHPAFVNLQIESREMHNHYVFWEDEEYRYYFTDECEVDTPYGMLLSNHCGFNSSDTLSIVTNIQYYDDGEIKYFSDLFLNVISVSEEYFYYYANMNYFLDDDVDIGLLFGASDPNIFKGNIEGGYGLFYGRNSTSVALPELSSEDE